MILTGRDFTFSRIPAAGWEAAEGKSQKSGDREGDRGWLGDQIPIKLGDESLIGAFDRAAVAGIAAYPNWGVA